MDFTKLDIKGNMKKGEGRVRLEPVTSWSSDSALVSTAIRECLKLLIN